jgi:hypothetical protein
MPRETAYVGMKKMGLNMPRNMKNIARMRRTKSGELKALGMKNAVVRDGRRAVTVRQVKSIIGSMMNAIIRMAQPKLIEEELSILDSAMGKTTPPIDEPAMASPNAAPRFLSKYCETAAMAGNCSMPLDIPTRTAWASMNCQYLVQRLVIIRANT